MARAGVGKAFSSGRIPIPGRSLSSKKRIAPRKASTAPAVSGYSLCSTDSEDQVLVINRGLDQCAVLLQDILQSEGRENTTKRTHVKSSGRVKKNAVKKPSTASHVHREKGGWVGSVLSNRRAHPMMSLKEVGVIVRKSAPWRGSSNVEVQRPPGTASSTAPPPTSCDHVQSQMQLLNRGMRSAASGPESAVLFNCRLATSTPTLTLSPRQSADPQVRNFMVDLPLRSLEEGAILPLRSLVEGAILPLRSLVEGAILPLRSMEEGAILPLRSMEEGAILEAQPTCQADQPSNSNKQISDSDLLQCVAAHLAQLHSEKESLATETEETSSDDEEVMMDKATARDISCQTSFNGNKKSSPKKTEEKIKTVKYLLGEIKALVADQDDGEALRLVTELEHSLSLLPAVVGSTNVLAEIALALQPLRSENTQLRRRLRILNQQLRERERTGRSDEQSSEVTSLQFMNDTLQQQLIESHKSLQSQQKKTEELLKVMETQIEENKTLSQIIQEKEEEILQILQQNDITSSRVRTDAAGNMKSLQFKLESAEKESQILAITLRQRDAEVTRLRELTRTLQASMAKLLCDLGKDKTRARPGGQLTQAALDSYDKQLRTDQCPASTSIISYLKRLEMDQVIPTAADQPDPAVPAYHTGLTSDPSDDFMMSKGHIHYQRPEPSVSSIPSHSPQKLRTESCSLIGDEYKPDETTYLPLASSPHKANFAPSARLMCTPPKLCSAERDVGDQINDFGASERNRTIQRGSFNAADTSDKPTKVQESDVPKTRVSSGGHLPPHLRDLRISRLNDPSARDVMSATSDWSIASVSTFTSHDEQDFRTGLAALDANIAKLQRTLQSAAKK
ncbi:PREDICTED: coiled-coil domain-containing protein 14 [Nanorana parkeri]|uniref:coiled-coil domain-containing protein 14 n=1 Tax=Nanorana parkeri TaxID=125878 RepID=UPI0008545837|nr:PREDICTED: coiled-coil domain-containing protein 14 [Nanorana parkeri]